MQTLSDETRIFCASPPEGEGVSRNAKDETFGNEQVVRFARPKGRILVVDDEANARTALAELLRDEGYQVETAADGFKALPKLEEFAPDLLLTDLRMPGMDGLELMGRARQLDPERAAVGETAHGGEETGAPARRKGGAG